MHIRHLAIALLTLLSALALAQGPQALSTLEFGEDRVYRKNVINLALRLPASFPRNAETLFVDFVCGEGPAGSYGGLPASWPEWVELNAAEVTPNVLTFQGYTIGCNEDWFYFEAPNLDLLLTPLRGEGVFRSGVWGVGSNNEYGLPHHSIAVTTLPFSQSLNQSGVLLLPLRSPLTPQAYELPSSGNAWRSNTGEILTFPDTVIAARQNGSLTPLLFEEQLGSLPFDASQPIELHYTSTTFAANRDWQHWVIDVDDARLAYRLDTTAPSSQATPTPDPASIKEALVPAAPPPPPPPPEIELETVTIQEGQNLWGIASEHDTTVEEIQRINCLDSPYVNPGRVIELPPEDDTYTPACGE